jgi:outer membrane biosynthesis protein TonB
VGLPQLDFRVPEAAWFKAALAGRFSSMPGLSATGALAWPYKIAVVAVMAIVACGTLVTFGSAEAETPSSSKVSALPGSDEASPRVEGQVLPATNDTLLNGADLMSSLNLMDYSPGDTTLSLSDNSDDNSDDTSDDTSDDAKKKATATKATPTPTPKPTTSKPAPEPTKTTAPAPEPTKTTAPAPEPTKTTAPAPEPTKCTVVNHLAGKC